MHQSIPPNWKELARPPGSAKFANAPQLPRGGGGGGSWAQVELTDA